MQPSAVFLGSKNRMTITFGCTDLNETNDNIFYFESSISLDLDDQIIARQACHKNNANN
jgi:hypothetical protein